MPVDPPNLKDYFRLIEKGERKLPDLLANILVRRTRQHILRWNGYDAETHEPVDPNRYQEYLQDTRKASVLVGGKHQFFPRRELQTIEYSIEDTYQGLYQELRGYLGKPPEGQTGKGCPGRGAHVCALWTLALRSCRETGARTVCKPSACRGVPAWLDSRPALQAV